ncbi:uncharacterized protein LOC105701095 [Orussus abietinus]|uniref:uncharacterized protein LOC105701095 n=1 Tax=Orussus abietinus TaxID=222816 RepID=UPI000624F8CF|nr:uncharacterized protein LOC105701095 [Orussus abietinus]
MSRQPFTSSRSTGNGGGEPLIVVEESTLAEEEAESQRNESPPRCVDPDSPTLNPYLLSPWRETRKHSLPTPQCTSGITASQVRRLSERGGEGSGPSPMEAAFLATLSQAPAPQPGGRRHSVVTISKVPPTLFGQARRESIAAFPLGGFSRILQGRRDSTPCVPPTNAGSTHNLQLDIMDDIADIKMRKVRMKMWKTPSHERVCEVQPLEGNSGAQRYTQYQHRRFSDFALTSTPLPPTAMRRRASEMPAKPPSIPRPTTSQTAGIVCSNTDLISILSSLASSATEINRCGEEAPSKEQLKSGSVKSLEQRRNRLKSFRSNSFDVSILHGTEADQQAGSSSKPTPSNWFIKRHQPMAKKQRSEDVAPASLSFKDEKSKMTVEAKTSPTKDCARQKVVWDDTSGTKVDAQVIGSVIEGFLTSQRGAEVDNGAGTSSGKPGSAGPKPRSSPSKVASWFSGGNKEEEQTESCDTSSLCSSLKDLFVK